MGYEVEEAVAEARQACNTVSQASASERQTILLTLSHYLIGQADNILTANALDIAHAREQGASEDTLTMLTLNRQDLTTISRQIELVARQPDVLCSAEQQRTEGGCRVSRLRVPLGLIGLIFDARPHLILLMVALGLKAGNVVIMRGGKQCRHTHLALAGCAHHVLKQASWPQAAVTLIPGHIRQSLAALLALPAPAELIVVHGTPGLMQYVAEHSKVPVLMHANRMSHLYIDAAANPATISDVLASLHRSEAGETVAVTCLVHRHQAESVVPLIDDFARRHSLILRACDESMPLAETAIPGNGSDYRQSATHAHIALCVVSNIDDATAHIETYGTGHTEVIITDSLTAAEHFTRVVDAAVVMVNAALDEDKTGFISGAAGVAFDAQKRPFRGPVTLEALTSQKWLIEKV